MIGIDSNVLIRVIANDDPEQVEQIKVFFSDRSAETPAYVSAVVLAETFWALRRRLGYSAGVIASALGRLPESDDLEFQHGDRLAALLNRPETFRGDLADHLIAWSAEDAGCARILTFDRRAARLVPAMELLA